MLASRALSPLYAFLAAVPCFAHADSGATEAVKKLTAGMESVLRQSAELGYRGRYDHFAPILDEAFDFPYMASQAIGRSWDELSPADQQRWTTAFRDLTISTYASRFNRYSGQTFETLGEEPAAHDTVVVRSRVVDPAAENVDLTYRMKETDGKWKVVDVYLKGSVSEIALRRSEFAAVLKRDGFEALLAAVKQKVGALASGTPVP